MNKSVRLIGALFAALGLALAALGFASAASAAPYVHQPSLAVSDATPSEGATVTFTGADYVADEDVTLVIHSSPVTLGTAHTDASGAFTFTVALPSGFTGTHTVIGTGATGDAASVDLDITSAGTSGGGLSNTGVAVLSIGGLGLVLLVAGGLMVLAGRRKAAA